MHFGLHRPRKALATVAALLLLSGCASTSPSGAFGDVRTDVAKRSGHDLRWDRNTAEDEEARRAIDGLFAKELTVDAAVQIALLASPHVRTKLEDLSIAQADLVQAGLLKNPVFSIGQTAWESEHIDPNVFVSIEQDFLDIVTMPARKKIAKAELEATRLDVGDAVLELAAEVRTAFFNAQAASQVVAMRRLVAEAAETSAEIAKRQHDAGNMNDLSLATEQALAAETGLERARAEAEAAVAREELNKRMGAWGPRTNWIISQKLPELPPVEPPLESLESRAIADRLDIEAARRQVQALDSAVSLAKATRWTGSITVGLQAGRLRNSKHLSFGPSVSVEVPLFDQRQAAIARLEAMRRQADNHLQELAIDVRADVRSARARVQTARTIVETYAKVVVPLRERIVALSQLHYDAMLLGVYQLIAAKQSEFDAYRTYIDALRDYWLARSDLERAIGSRLEPVRPAAAVKETP
ncbi:Copper tolerance protein [Labilithrix luteola]|uniref:Copper tolerance protein n=1 Tax=Labilithrix luteola TaxID=1391654 RepID=A0A0K1QC97_9BACT|nr:TolC family protein [Labilithrix luteola]AKV03406.1 Copper tolerance protein [Labilithrix luteola]